MTDHGRGSQSRAQIIDAIGKEFARLEEEDGQATHLRRRRSATRSGKVVAVVFVAGLLTGGAAGAATGLLPVGSVIPGGSDPENPSPHGHEAKTVVARGVGAVAGPWRLSSLRREADPETGEPPSDCLELVRTKPAPGSIGIGGTLLCQPVGTFEFKADSVPVVDPASGRAETLLFGMAPEAATTVELNADGEQARRTASNRGMFNLPGGAWVMVVPSGAKTAKLRALDGGGNARATLDASTYLEQLAIWERNAASRK